MIPGQRPLPSVADLLPGVVQLRNAPRHFGTFVQGRPKTPFRPEPLLRPAPVDLTMNLPPEPDDPELIGRMRAGLEAVGRDLVVLLRYQPFGGSPADKEAAIR